MSRILVVEDEETIAAAVADRLRSSGFDVEVVHDGRAAVDRCETRAPDLVILDLNLGGLDGLSVCREIQTTRRIPVLMLTARADESDVLVGLAVGADDYMTKPFSMKELMARVQAILRRVSSMDAAERSINVGALHIDERTRIVLGPTGDRIHLTPLEFDLLVALVRGAGRVFSRDQLLMDVWGYRDNSGARTVDSHVRSLRRKLGDGFIRTVHGVGYAAEVVQ